MILQRHDEDEVLKPLGESMSLATHIDVGASAGSDLVGELLKQLTMHDIDPDEAEWLG